MVSRRRPNLLKWLTSRAVSRGKQSAAATASGATESDRARAAALRNTLTRSAAGSLDAFDLRVPPPEGSAPARKARSGAAKAKSVQEEVDQLRDVRRELLFREYCGRDPTLRGRKIKELYLPGSWLKRAHQVAPRLAASLVLAVEATVDDGGATAAQWMQAHALCGGRFDEGSAFLDLQPATFLHAVGGQGSAVAATETGELPALEARLPGHTLIVEERDLKDPRGLVAREAVHESLEVRERHRKREEGGVMLGEETEEVEGAGIGAGGGGGTAETKGDKEGDDGSEDKGE